MSDMYRSMVSMFDPVAETGVELDATACLPYPYEPNWKIYDEIGILKYFCYNISFFNSKQINYLSTRFVSNEDCLGLIFIITSSNKVFFTLKNKIYTVQLIPGIQCQVFIAYWLVINRTPIPKHHLIYSRK